MTLGASLSGQSTQPVDGPRRPERVAQERPTTTRATERRSEKRLERPTQGRLSDSSRFAIDLDAVPRGYVMEWKRHTVVALVDKSNQVLVRRFHWQPVPHKLQPQILGHLCDNDDEHVVVDGLGLYMRPDYLNSDAMAESRDTTNWQLNQQLESLRMSSKDQVGQKNTYIKKQTVAIPQAVE